MRLRVRLGLQVSVFPACGPDASAFGFGPDVSALGFRGLGFCALRAIIFMGPRGTKLEAL